MLQALGELGWLHIRHSRALRDGGVEPQPSCLCLTLAPSLFTQMFLCSNGSSSLSVQVLPCVVCSQPAQVRSLLKFYGAFLGCFY